MLAAQLKLSAASYGHALATEFKFDLMMFVICGMKAAM
jgi:hypothetical protein